MAGGLGSQVATYHAVHAKLCEGAGCEPCVQAYAPPIILEHTSNPHLWVRLVNRLPLLQQEAQLLLGGRERAAPPLPPLQQACMGEQGIGQ